MQDRVKARFTGKVKITMEWEDGEGKKEDSIDATVLHGLIGMLERRFFQVRVSPKGRRIQVEAWGKKL